MICLNGCKNKLKLLQDIKYNNNLEIVRLKMDIAAYIRIIDEHSQTITDLTCKYKAEKEKLNEEIERLEAVTSFCKESSPDEINLLEEYFPNKKILKKVKGNK